MSDSEELAAFERLMARYNRKRRIRPGQIWASARGPVMVFIDCEDGSYNCLPVRFDLESATMADIVVSATKSGLHKPILICTLNDILRNLSGYLGTVRRSVLKGILDFHIGEARHLRWIPQEVVKGRDVGYLRVPQVCFVRGHFAGRRTKHICGVLSPETLESRNS